MVAIMILGTRFSFDRSSNTKSHTSDRVPQTLQTVFIVAGRGKEIHKPPPNGVAQRTFPRLFSKRSKAATENVGKNTHQSARSIIENDDTNSDYSIEAEVSKVIKRASLKSLEAVPPAPVTTPLTSVISTKNHISPQAYVVSLLKNRGYSDASFTSLDTGYYNKPTPLQVASHGMKIIETVRTNNSKLLNEIMCAGLSPNACNEHGESIVHMICRMGHKELFEILLKHGCSIQVCDDYGRTPLHDACWASEVNFDLIDLILERDPRLLFVKDSRGSVPLQYLHNSHWFAWTKYFMSRKDRFWPDRCVIKQGMQPDPELTMVQPNSRPVVDPQNAAPLELARLVAQGRMSPAEAMLVRDDLEKTFHSNESGSSSDEGDSEYDSESDDYDDDEDEMENAGSGTADWSESTFDDREMQDILGCLGKGKAIAWSSKS